MKISQKSMLQKVFLFAAIDVERPGLSCWGGREYIALEFGQLTKESILRWLDDRDIKAGEIKW